MVDDFPKLTKVIIDGVDVSDHVVNWETEDVYNDAIGTAKIVLGKTINSVLPITQLDTPGLQITIQRGVNSATEEWVFRGEILDIETQGIRYIVNCANKFYEAVRSEVTTSWDINIDEEQGVGSAIYKSLIERYTSLIVDAQVTPSEMLITKFICNHADVFERAEKIVEAYNWQHYYDVHEDKIILEPRGNNTGSQVLEVGENVANVPKWKYSKEKLINELTLKGAEQSVQRTVFINGDNTEDQVVVLNETPTSVKVYVGTGSFDPTGTGTKPSNNEGNLKRGGKKGSTSGEYDYEYDDDSRVRTIYFKSSSSSQPELIPPTGVNNIEVQYTYNLPTPVVDKRPVSISKYGLHKKTHTRGDIKNIADAELYVQTTLDFFERPMISTNIIVSHAQGLRVGWKYRVVDSFENIDEYLIITKIKKVYPFSGDEITIGDDVTRVAQWEIATMDRVKRLEELQGESQDLLLHIVKNIRTTRAEKRYFELRSRNVAGETGIYGHPVYGLYGTAKYGGEADLEEWQTIRIIQGENNYKELLYDDLFFDDVRSDSGVIWDYTNKEIIIPPQQTLYTKSLELNSGRTTFNVRFGLTSINLSNMVVSVTYDNVNWIEVSSLNTTVNFPVPATDIRLKIFNEASL